MQMTTRLPNFGNHFSSTSPPPLIVLLCQVFELFVVTDCICNYLAQDYYFSNDVY